MNAYSISFSVLIKSSQLERVTYIRDDGIDAKLGFRPLGKSFCGIFFALHHEALFERPSLIRLLYVLDQAVLVGMRGVGTDGADVRADLDRLAEDRNFFRAVLDAPSEG